MLLRIISSFLLFFFSFIGMSTRPVCAESKTAPSAPVTPASSLPQSLDSETRIVLKAVAARYQKLGNWEATFTQETYSVGLAQGNFNEGRFSFQKPNLFRYSIIRPESSDFISNGKEAWQIIYRKGREKSAYVRHFGSIERIDLNRYLFLLRGIGAYSPNKEKELLKNFSLKGSVVNESLGLEITPRSSEEISKIVLNFEKNSLAPSRAILTDALGNKTTLIIMSFQSSAAIEPKTFKPDFPKDSEVENL